MELTAQPGELNPSTGSPDTSDFELLHLPILPANGALTSVAQLLLAEEYLDDMEFRDRCLPEYESIRARAQAYIRANPDLLTEPWLRADGAVRDLIEQIREEVFDKVALATDALYASV